MRISNPLANSYTKTQADKTFINVANAENLVFLSSGKLLVDGWGSSAPYTQTITMTCDLAFTNSNSEIVGPVMCQQNSNISTNQVLAVNLARINSGTITLSSTAKKITFTTYYKPDSDITVYLYIQKRA